MNVDINRYEYEQYTSVWCKAVDIASLKTCLQSAELSDIAVIKELIEEISMYLTPESWCGHFQLLKDTWHRTHDEHESVANAIMDACRYYQEIEKQDAMADRDEYLSWYGFDEGMASVQNASPEQQQQANALLDIWYESAVIDKDNQLTQVVFSAHDELKETFLNHFFDDTVRFYINKTAEEARTWLLDDTQKKKITPAIIGMDNEKAAMMWFNY